MDERFMHGLPSDPPFRSWARSCRTLPRCERVFLLRAGAEDLAQAAVWRRRGAPDADRTELLVLGHFGCVDADAGRELLLKACQVLGSIAPAARIIGPMDEDPWHRYRIRLSSPGETGSFLGEPENPGHWLASFEGAGFRPELSYESREAMLDQPGPELGRLSLRLQGQGFRSRPLTEQTLERDLALLHPLCDQAFKDNPYFQAIEWEAFRDRHLGIAPLLSAGLSMVTEDAQGRACAMVLAYPDTRAPQLNRVVLKTLATHPSARHLGIGAWLTEEVHAKARRLGFRSVVHALMADGNSSNKTSNRYQSRTIRRYALYGRTL